MTTPTTIARTKSIHAVLDAAAPIVARNPSVVAVWVENTYQDQREPRYEFANGDSVYGDEDVVMLVSSGLRTGRADTYPGAIRFEAREVGNWPTMKEEMAIKLTRCPRQQFVFWNSVLNVVDDWGICSVEQSIDSAASNSQARDNVARGLFMTREMLVTLSAPPPAKREVELEWRLPTKDVVLPAGTKVRFASEERLLIDGAICAPSARHRDHCEIKPIPGFEKLRCESCLSG